MEAQFTVARSMLFVIHEELVLVLQEGAGVGRMLVRRVVGAEVAGIAGKADVAIITIHE